MYLVSNDFQKSGSISTCRPLCNTAAELSTASANRIVVDRPFWKAMLIRKENIMTFQMLHEIVTYYVLKYFARLAG